MTGFKITDYIANCQRRQSKLTGTEHLGTEPTLSLIIDLLLVRMRSRFDFPEHHLFTIVLNLKLV